MLCYHSPNACSTPVEKLQFMKINIMGSIQRLKMDVSNTLIMNINSRIMVVEMLNNDHFLSDG